MKPTRPWYTRTWLHVAIILVVAGLFRLWQLQTIPPGLFGDEATDGLDALDVLAGRGSVFFPANFGREGLHMWIVAAAFRLLGVTPLALRLPSALAGIATALATYWLGRELLEAYRRPGMKGRSGDASDRRPILAVASLVPLLAALYLATSFWHVHFSRFGIRGVFTPLCAALACAAFWRAVNAGDAQAQAAAGSNMPTSSPRSRWDWFLISGFLLGLATHFYTASRFLPLFLGGFLIVQGVVALASGRWKEALLRRYFREIVLLYLMAALVFAPLGLYFFQHPGSFMQRANEVSAFGAGSPWLRMAQAAIANVIQFFVPGRGDPEQFYNLPGRSVFDPLTAVLSLVGIAILLWRWRQPTTLFLLLWFPALLLPSFLATDRWPTLPRVLGVIPAVYFYPAIGLAAVATAVQSAARRRRSSTGAEADAAGEPTPTWALLICTVALLVHASLTYRDYFYIWGPSQATFDQFEGDMTSAWQWLDNHPPSDHVYLSSDIYRHPTFMLLHEHATVQTFFEHQNPSLSWFDARDALPLPPEGQTATYVIGSSAPLSAQAAAAMGRYAQVKDHVPAPDGSDAVTVFEWEDRAGRPKPDSSFPPVTFTGQLALTGAALGSNADGSHQLTLRWATSGPDPDLWRAYRLEIEGRATVPFEAFRPPEWTPGGGFLTWHRLEGDIETPVSLRLRLWDQRDQQPITSPGAPDGWHEITVP